MYSLHLLLPFFFTAAHNLNNRELCIRNQYKYININFKTYTYIYAYYMMKKQKYKLDYMSLESEKDEVKIQ